MDKIPDKPGEFYQKTTLWIAVAGLVILTPFSINNFIQGRLLLGLGSVAIVIILAINAWYIRQGRNYEIMILVGLVPAIIFFLLISIINQGMIGVLWCYPAVITFYMVLNEKKAWIANILLLVIAVTVSWEHVETPLAIRMTATLLAVSIFTAIFTRIIIVQQNKLKTMAVTDPLTGLYNRILLHDSLEQAIQHNNRSGEPMTLITLDLDNFKKVNDTFGHDAGDNVLQDVASLLNKRLRRIDKVFRLGGEEFLVLLHGSGKENGQQIAEQIRKEISSLATLPDQAITTSIGVATFEPGESWSAWMKRSDENLYRAKMDGRNRVVA